MADRQAASRTVPPLSVLVGKGGVGRSTVAAAMGLVSARAGRRTVIVEVAGSASVPGMFGVEPRGPAEPVPCRTNLWAVRVTWEDALREYGLKKLYFKAAFRLVFENPFVRRLLPAIPGLSEIVVAGKIVFMATDGDSTLGKVDSVILDAPATGHGISLLAAPMAVTGSVAEGPLADDARRLRDVLLDRQFTRVHIVTTPEEMPVTESIELHERLTAAHGFTLGPMLVNSVQGRGLTDMQEQALTALLGGGRAPEAVACAARAARFMTSRFDVQQAHVMRLRRCSGLVMLPEVAHVREARERIETLADHLEAALG